MGDTVVKITNLSKSYGNRNVLCDVNMELPNGMFGLLGKNGAGKTTLIKIMASLMAATSGECLIGGISVREKKKVRKQIGYIPQEFSLYPELTCYEMLDYFMLLEGKNNLEERQERIFQVLEQVGLSEQMHKKIKQLSGGMKRRMGVAQALLSNPKVILADEPTVGLDPEERARLRHLFCELAKKRVIVFSTHIVSDIEDACDRLAILQEGKVLYQGTAEKLKEDAGQRNGTLEEIYLSMTAEEGR